MGGSAWQCVGHPADASSAVDVRPSCLVLSYSGSYQSSHKRRHLAAGSVAPVRGTAPGTKSSDSGKDTVPAVVAVVLDDGVDVDDDVLVIAAVVAEIGGPVVAQMARK